MLGIKRLDRVRNTQVHEMTNTQPLINTVQDFKVFYKAIAFNSFLFQIGRKDSPLCSFCSKSPETMLHVFCKCEKVRPIWDELLQLINDNLHAEYTLDNFDLMFGVSDDSLVTFLILCCKFYIYRCKFQEVSPNCCF